MDDKKVYTDINRIINTYVVKEEESSAQLKAQAMEKEIQEMQEAIKAKQAALAEFKRNQQQQKTQQTQQTQSEDHKPGEDYEYDYEGSMAKTQLTQITQAAEKLMSGMKDDENLPEWVQSKIAVACDYMIKVASYLDATEEQDQQAMEKKPAIQMPNLPKPPAVSGMMSNALGSRPAVGISMNTSSMPEDSDRY